MGIIMNIKEAKDAIKTLKDQGLTDEQLSRAWHSMFVDDKLTIDELEMLCLLLGYKFTDKFKKMSPKDQKTNDIEFVEEQL